MLIEKHAANENPHDIAFELKSTYKDTDRFSILYTSEQPQEAEKRFLYALMQKEAEYVYSLYGKSKDCFPIVDYIVKPAESGGAEIRFMSNLTPNIIKSIFPEAKTVMKSVRKRYGAAHESGDSWLQVAIDLL